MTPAIRILQDTDTPHEISEYDAAAVEGDYGVHAARTLALSADQVFKTLVAETDGGELIVAVVPVSQRLHMKSLAAAAGAKRAFMADRARVEKTTGYVVGGVSPLGQKKRLRTFIDDSARALARLHVSGGRRGLEITLDPRALARLLDARFAAIGRPG